MNFFNGIRKENNYYSSILEERIKEIQNDNFKILCVTKNKSRVAKLISTIDLKIEIYAIPDSSETIKIISSEYSSETEAPDLIILEILTNQKNPYKLYEELFLLPSLRNTPVFFIAIKASFEDKMQGIGNGAQDFICLYNKTDELKIKIINLLYMMTQVKAKSSHKLKTSLFKTMRSSSKQLIDLRFKKYNITQKEKAILRLILDQDMGYKEISRTLKMSESGIKKRIYAICQKCGVKGKKELIMLFLNK